MMYVVVDFPESTMPEDQKLIPNQPKTWIPIPLFTRRCKNKCYSITAIPLMICKSLSTHKSQGMTVGQGKQFTKVEVNLPVGVGGNKCPGLELMAVIRAVELNDFAVGNSITELTKHALLRIGNTDAYCAQNKFLDETRRKSITSQEPTIVAITQLDTTTTSNICGRMKILVGVVLEYSSLLNIDLMSNKKIRHHLPAMLWAHFA
jgi:hypothetical protein